MYACTWICMIIIIVNTFVLTTTSKPISVQLITTTTSTSEASISVYTYLGTIICSFTTLINIWMNKSVCIIIYLRIFISFSISISNFYIPYQIVIVLALVWYYQNNTRSFYIPLQIAPLTSST